MTYDKLVFWCNINLWKMQSENTNIELLRNTIDIFMDVTGYRFLVKEQFITFLLDIPWYDVYFIQASQYVLYNLFLIQKWSSIEIKYLHKLSYNWKYFETMNLWYFMEYIFLHNTWVYQYYHKYRWPSRYEKLYINHYWKATQGILSYLTFANDLKILVMIKEVLT